MLKTNYKKALLAATVLTAFCANAAFAGEAPDKPTMRERVNKILKHFSPLNFLHFYQNEKTLPFDLFYLLQFFHLKF